MWDSGGLFLPAYEQIHCLPYEMSNHLTQSVKWILIFPGALIKDLSINDPIPHLMILKDLSAAFWQDSQLDTMQPHGHSPASDPCV